MSFRILAAVLFLGCCLVSSVAAFDGGCGCSLHPAGGWGAPSTGAFWGMSLEDIKNAPATSDTTIETGPWRPPELVLPTSNSGKFASLNDYISKSGGSGVASTYSNIGASDYMSKPTVDGSSGSPFSSLSITSGQLPKTGGIVF